MRYEDRVVRRPGPDRLAHRVGGDQPRPRRHRAVAVASIRACPKASRRGTAMPPTPTTSPGSLPSMTSSCPRSRRAAPAADPRSSSTRSRCWPRTSAPVGWSLIGGSGSLQVSPGLRLMDVARLPPEAQARGRDAGRCARAAPRHRRTVDWLYISPANRIGPGERTGGYRIGHETPIGDWVSAEDFAVAVLDEIETPRYRRTHINVAT